MASQKQIDVNCISLNGNTATDGRLVAITIDDIVSVWKDGDNVTTIKYAPRNDNHTSLTPEKYKVTETLAAILVKANAADSSNGLISVTVTKANGSTLSTPKVQLLNRVKIQKMVPITGGGTLIWYGHWRRSVLEISENLVTDTASS